jgi:hypothetical protein
MHAIHPGARAASVRWAGVVASLAWMLAAACTPAQQSAPEATAAAGGQELPPPREDVPTPIKAMLVGSWAPDPEEGFDHAWLDEAGLREVYSLQRASRRIWKGFSTDDDTLPLDLLIRDREGPAVAYVYVLSYRDDPTLAFPDAPAVLHVRHRGRLQARLDGALVLDAPAPPPGHWGEARAPVTLTSSYDVLLLKLGRGSPELGDSLDVQVRLSAPDGTPIPTQGWYTMRPPGRPSDLVPREQWPQPEPPPDEPPADG